MSEEDVELSLRDEIMAASEPEAEETPAPETTSEEVDGSADTNVDQGDSQSTTEDTTPIEQEAAPGEKDLSAPMDWDPTLREDWKNLPKGVKDKVVAREQQMQQAMHGTAQARQTQQQLGQLANTYSAVVASEGGGDALQAIDNVMHTANMLRVGTPSEKATLMANMISHFGIDVKMLDGVLVGQPASDPAVSQMEQMLEQRMAPVNQMMQNLAGMQQQRMQQSNQETQNEIQQFAQSHEFFDNVRPTMAAIIQSATQQNQVMSMDDAYRIACDMNPQIKQVLDQRAEQERLVAQQNTIGAKQNAASSVVGQGQGSIGRPSDNLTDVLRDAWDSAAG